MTENLDIQSFDAKRMAVRVIAAVVVLVVLAFAWISIRRQYGNMFAELTSPADPNAQMMADLARSMAPSDPVTSWLKATIEKSIFTPEHTDKAVSLFEETVRLSPYDFRWWIELGRAYEQAEIFDKAEQALNRAVEIAPTYTYPRWQLGNFLLRQGRTDEAFAQLKLATANNITYRDQVFSLAWDYFDKDPAMLEQYVVEDHPDIYASLALFYGSRGRATDSLRIWNRLSDDEKAEHPEFVKVLSQGLFEQRFYPEALEFTKQVGMDTDSQPEAVTNGGFEKTIGSAENTRFGWRIDRSEGKMDISSDSSVKHEGARSLKSVFRGYSQPEMLNIGQIVVVVPQKAYRLRFWVRTENLKSAGTPQVQVVNAADNEVLASTRPFSTGTNDWELIELDLTTPADCRGIEIRTVRSYCGDNCPIVGIVWYDDFSITGL